MEIMKRLKQFDCWTDYPILELGDISGQPAPYRGVTVLCYDGDRYARVKIRGTEICIDIKTGYLYSNPGKTRKIHGAWYPIPVNRRKFELMKP